MNKRRSVGFNVESTQVRECPRIPQEETKNFWVSKDEINVARKTVQAEALMGQARVMVKQTLAKSSAQLAADNDTLESFTDKVMDQGIDAVMNFLKANGVVLVPPTGQSVPAEPPLPNSAVDPEAQVRNLVRQKLISEQSEPFDEDGLERLIIQIMQLPRNQILGFLQGQVPLTAKKFNIMESTDYWADIPQDIKDAAMGLGYDQESWDNSQQPEETSNKSWKELSPFQRECAVKLGYDQNTWDGIIEEDDAEEKEEQEDEDEDDSPKEEEDEKADDEDEFLSNFLSGESLSPPSSPSNKRETVVPASRDDEQEEDDFINNFLSDDEGNVSNDDDDDDYDDEGGSINKDLNETDDEDEYTSFDASRLEIAAHIAQLSSVLDSELKDIQAMNNESSTSRKFAKNQIVLYKSNGRTEKAKIVDVHLDDDLIPFYTILLLESEREKQTDYSHLEEYLENSTTTTTAAMRRVVFFLYKGKDDVVPSNVTHILVDSSVTEIPPHAFHHRTFLIHIELPEGLRVIGSGAFLGCTSLVHLRIPSTVTVLPKLAFCNCRRLVTVQAPTTIKAVHDFCFWGCIMLRNVSIPSSSKIGHGIFYGCDALRLALLTDDHDRIVSALTHRFDELPVHELLYHHHYYHSSRQNAKTAARNVVLFLQAAILFDGSAMEKVDCLGMTPFHILTLSGITPPMNCLHNNTELWQSLLSLQLLLYTRRGKGEDDNATDDSSTKQASFISAIQTKDSLKNSSLEYVLSYYSPQATKDLFSSLR